MIEGFLLDQNLGRLARWLRLMGWPAKVVESFPPRPPVGWRALTRARVLAARPGFTLIKPDDLAGQLKLVISALGLEPDPNRFFTRCLECDREVEPLDRRDAAGLVPEYTLHTAQRFTRCPACGRVFWPGSHGERALVQLERLLAGEPALALTPSPGHSGKED